VLERIRGQSHISREPGRSRRAWRRFLTFAGIGSVRRGFRFIRWRTASGHPSEDIFPNGSRSLEKCSSHSGRRGSFHRNAPGLPRGWFRFLLLRGVPTPFSPHAAPGGVRRGNANARCSEKRNHPPGKPAAFFEKRVGSQPEGLEYGSPGRSPGSVMHAGKSPERARYRPDDLVYLTPSGLFFVVRPQPPGLRPGLSYSGLSGRRGARRSLPWSRAIASKS